MSFFYPLFGYALLNLGLCAAATLAVCGFGSWALVVPCGLPRQISLFPQPPHKQKCAPRWEKALDHSLFHNPTLCTNKHVVQICHFSLSAAADGLTDDSGEGRTSPLNGDAQSWNGIDRSHSRAIQWISFFLRKTLNSCLRKTHGKKGMEKSEKSCDGLPSSPKSKQGGKGFGILPISTTVTPPFEYFGGGGHFTSCVPSYRW